MNITKQRPLVPLLTRAALTAVLTLGALAPLGVAAAASSAEARPGGGHSYSRSSSSSSRSSSSSSRGSWGSSGSSSTGWASSSSSSGSGGRVELGPETQGIAFLLIIAVFFAAFVQVQLEKRKRRDTWNSAPPAHGHRAPQGLSAPQGVSAPQGLSAPQGPPPVARADAPLPEPVEQAPAAPTLATPAVDLMRIAERDPDFSTVLFKDFFFRLFATAWTSRHDRQALKALRPYFGNNAVERLTARQPQGALSDVVIGRFKPLSVQLPRTAADPFVVIRVEIEANVVSTSMAGQRSHWYSLETWSLRRPAKLTSRPPEKIASLGCPGCGAPFETADGSSCKYCGEAVAAGQLDWSVSDVRVRQNRPMPPPLGGYAEEVGTDDPTVIHPARDERWAALVEEDPALTHERLEARLQLIFHTMNTGWSANDLSAVRAFVSDGMHDYLRYWIDAYVDQGLRNKNEQTALLHWEPVKVERDKYFDALTVRVWAEGLDTTVRADTGELVGGDALNKRRYSEYWTLIRSRGQKTPAVDDKHCPNCGAPLAITMGGNCTHCDAHITSGEFDWVLSLIEQDEAYAG